jgi:TrmH family RNA methyltransferase
VIWFIVNQSYFRQEHLMKYPPVSKATLTRLRKLQTRKGREEERRFVVEGLRIVQECLATGLTCHSLIVTDSFLEKERMTFLASCLPGLLSENEFKRIADTQNPQGILAEFSQPSPPRSLIEMSKELPLSQLSPILILDQMQDPGNTGTVIRCAAGLGAAGVMMLQGCVDLWNPKTLRASAGAIFKTPVWTDLQPEEVQTFLEINGYSLWIASAQGESIYTKLPAPIPLALVIGNEAHGVSSFWLESSHAYPVGIPMTAGVDSLNVATATAVLLALIRKLL